VLEWIFFLGFGATILLSFFAWMAALSKPFQAGVEVGAHQVRALDLPPPVRVSLVRCVEDLRWPDKYNEKAGYSPRPWHVLSDPAPDLVEALASLVITECAEQFVLGAGTVDDMLIRSEMLMPYLSDDFREGDLALALYGVDIIKRLDLDGARSSQPTR
jgi:hypothetical protein